MKVSIYYRGFSKKLHQINDIVGDDETVDEVVSQTRSHLKDEGTLFSEPILALIQGGKA